MPLQEKSLGAALHEELTLHSTLCRREAGAFQQAIRSGEEVIVACTQEKRLFTELAEQTEGAVSPIRFGSFVPVARINDIRSGSIRWGTCFATMSSSSPAEV